MAGFGNLYSEMGDDNFDYNKVYDANEVFGRLGGGEEQIKSPRPAVSRTESGVIVERRRSRSYKLPY